MKKIKIVIIFLISILLLGSITFAGLYFFTDIFKSNKELFYKAMSQIINKENIVITETEKNYLNKIETEKTKTTVDFKINATINEEEMLNSLNIAYLGLNDPKNKDFEEKINIKNGDQELIDLSFIRNNDFYGFIVKDVLNKYITIENKDLKQLALKLGIEDVSNIPDKIEEIKLSDMLTNEEQNEKIYQILEKYSNIIIEEIPNQNYTKIKETITLDSTPVEATGYRLSLKVIDIYNLLNIILPEMKQDKQLFELITELNNFNNISYQEYQGEITELLKEINTSLISEEIEDIEVMQINLYQQNNKVVKQELNIFSQDETYVKYVLSIENLNNKNIYDFSIMPVIEETEFNYQEYYYIKAIQETNGDIEKWDIKVSQKIGTEAKDFITIKIKNNKVTEDLITSNIEIKVDYEELKLNIEGTINFEFLKELEIQKLTTENAVILNNKSKEEIMSILNSATEEITKKLFPQIYQIQTNSLEAAQKAMEEQTKQLEEIERLQNLDSI